MIVLDTLTVPYYLGVVTFGLHPLRQAFPGAALALFSPFLAFSSLSLRSLDQERLTTLRQSVGSTLFLKTAGWHRSFYPKCRLLLFNLQRNEA